VEFTAWAYAHASLHVTSAGLLGWNMTNNPDFSGGQSVISVDWSAGMDRLELNYLNTVGGFAPTENIPVPYDTWLRIRLSLSPVGYQFVLTVDDGGSTVYYSGTAAHMPGYLFKSLDVVTTNNAGMQTWIDDVSIGYGGDADVWGTPVSLAGEMEVYEQPNDPGAVTEGAIWIDTDSTVVPYVDEPDVGGSGGDYENVRDYGAVGDGVHNDGPAIQDAIDAAAISGRPVYFPAGTYLISQQLNLHTGTTLEGVGRTSIVKLVDGHPANIDMITTAMGDGTRDVTIRRLCVDGNKDTIGTEGTWTTETGIWTTCLHLLDVTNLVLEDLLIKNSTIEGVYLGQVHYGSVTRVEASENGFWRSDASGIHLDGSSHLVVSDCVTNSNGFHGIIFSAATDNVVTNHYSADNGFDGSRLQWSADRNRFEKFISERNSRGLYVMHDSTLNHFSHCTLRNSLWNGFFSNNCHGNYLLFTHIEGSGEYAVGSVEAGDNQYGFGNTYRNNALGEYSLAAGSTFTAISGAGSAI
jgi:parallel beta-helix repeat protein